MKTYPGSQVNQTVKEGREGRDGGRKGGVEGAGGGERERERLHLTDPLFT